MYLIVSTTDIDEKRKEIYENKLGRILAACQTEGSRVGIENVAL